MTRGIAEVFAEIETWTNVADELTKRGIKGKPDCSERCPMANYIIGETDPHKVSLVDVQLTSTSYASRVGELDFIDNPVNMSRFIAGFDEGAYPDLAEDPWDFAWLDDEDEDEED